MRGWTIALDVNNFKVFSSENKCLVFAILILADSHVEFCCHSVSCMISQKKEFALFLWKEVEFYIKSLFFACLSTGVLAKKAL